MGESNSAAEKRAARVRMFIYFAAGMAGLLFGLDQALFLAHCRLLPVNGS